MDMLSDPVFNVIYRGFKEPVKHCMENGHSRAALTLIFTSIDAMAKLGMPEKNEKSGRKFFNEWCNKYLILTGIETIEGIEWFAARSGLIHNYTAESELSRDGKARMIGYYTGQGPDIRYDPEVSNELVLVRIEGLVKAYFDGIDRFIIDLYKNNDHKVIHSRFEKMYHDAPIS